MAFATDVPPQVGWSPEWTGVEPIAAPYRAQQANATRGSYVWALVRMLPIRLAVTRQVFGQQGIISARCRHAMTIFDIVVEWSRPFYDRAMFGRRQARPALSVKRRESPCARADRWLQRLPHSNERDCAAMDVSRRMASTKSLHHRTPSAQEPLLVVEVNAHPELACARANGPFELACAIVDRPGDRETLGQVVDQAQLVSAAFGR